MKISMTTGKIILRSMSKADYETLAWVINNHKKMSTMRLCKGAGIDKRMLTALMKTFGLNSETPYAFVNIPKKKKSQPPKEDKKKPDDEVVVEKDDTRSEGLQHEERLEMLKANIATASRDKIVSHPYKLHPTLGVSEWEQAMFNYYEELYLWEYL